MANIAKWVLDANWTSVSFTAGDLNSLASGGFALSTAAITNGTSLDLYADVSLIITVGGTTLVSSYLPLFLLPLQQDGSTYGDGSASSSSVMPVASYVAASCMIKSGVTSGNTIQAMYKGIVTPPGDFKLGLGNGLGVALNATAALTMKIRTYNENLNG